MLGDSEARVRVGLFCFAAALLLPIVAVGLPWLVFPDADDLLTNHDVAVMKTEAKHWSKVPPLRLQIRHASPPEEVLGVPAGVLTWRTIFGVPYGRTELGRAVEGSAATDWHWSNFRSAWLAFIGAELSLIAAGTWLAWRDP